MARESETVTDDEVDDYIRHLHAHLPPAQGRLTVEQIRAVLDAEADYFERRFGKIHGWRALVRAIFGRGEPPPEAVEAVLPEFEAHALRTLAGRSDLTREDIRAVMRVEGDVGPRWVPPRPSRSGPEDAVEGSDG